MKNSFATIMMGCCFSAVIGLTACGDDEDELTQKEPVVNPIPDPEPEVTLPEITGFGHAIAFGGNSITGQDASYAIPLEREMGISRCRPFHELFCALQEHERY